MSDDLKKKTAQKVYDAIRSLNSALNDAASLGLVVNLSSIETTTPKWRNSRTVFSAEIADYIEDANR